MLRLPARCALLCAAALAGSSAAASPAVAAPSQILTIRTPHAPGTPARYDRVQVRTYGPAKAGTVLLLVPGTLGGAADFHVLAPALVRRVPGLQVWALMRREGALHDTRVLQQARAGRVSVEHAFDYYLGWLAKPTVRDHYEPLTAADHAYVGEWGLKVAIDDLHAVVQRARRAPRGSRSRSGASGSGRAARPRRVILGGHSLGGSVAGIYAAWEFGGRAGARDLAGLVEIDGGAGGLRDGAPTTTADARAALARIEGRPFTDLLGLGLPWIAGAFGELSALAAHVAPAAPSIGQTFPLLPAAFRAPVPVTNRAQLGYAFDAKTSPPGLALIQVRSGALATSGDPRDWLDDRAQPTPIANLANAFSLEPLGAIEWYYPARLSVDVGAGAALRQTAAARALGLRITRVGAVDVPLYAFGAALAGRDGALKAGALRYRSLSRIPSVTYVDRSATYSHLDPLLAAPERSALVSTLAPWLKRTMKRPAR